MDNQRFGQGDIATMWKMAKGKGAIDEGVSK